MANRAWGYYWVRKDGRWMPAKYDGDYWYNIDYEGPIDEREFDEIGDRLELYR